MEVSPVKDDPTIQALLKDIQTIKQLLEEQVRVSIRFPSINWKDPSSVSAGRLATGTKLISRISYKDSFPEAL